MGKWALPRAVCEALMAFPFDSKNRAGTGVPDKTLSRFYRSLWLATGILFILAVIFVIYVQAEKRIDHANELRLRSFLLADELRQSSDDLTRMVRSYVITGNPIYKQHYQEILDIRDGKASRPVDYHNVYWDLVLDDDRRPTPGSGQRIALLDLMRQTAFTEQELGKLAEAKAQSDALTRTEFAAMALVESGNPRDGTVRLQASEMLHDAAYHRAKAAIMRPIGEFYRMLDLRTLNAVHASESFATAMRATLMVFGALLLFALRCVYRALHAALGGSLADVHKHIARLGCGDFSGAIAVARGAENSILGWLSETQHELARIDAQRRQVEQEIRQLNNEFNDRVRERTVQLEAANAELEEFSYSMSHDMQAPLRAIDGFSRILLEEHAGSLDEEGQRLLHELRGNALRMGKLIDDITVFLQMGRRRLKRETLDMAGMARAAVAALRAARPEHFPGVIFHEIPPAWGDCGMVQQVWLNLLSNAVKFSSSEADAVIEVGTILEAGEPAYYVRDTGVGFEMRYADKLFRVFERLHSPGEYAGTGIGLAIVKRIVERHGGRVWAQGSVGRGAVFYFTLPKNGG